MGAKPRRQPVEVCRQGIKYRGAVRAVHYLNPKYDPRAWEKQPGVQGLERGGCGTSYRYFETEDWSKVTCKVCIRGRATKVKEELDLPEGIVRTDYRGTYMWQARNHCLKGIDE
jgi:hypothetical protein